MKISEIITKEIEMFSSSVIITEGYSINWHDIVKRITLYQNDKFLERQDDGSVFWNISSPQSPHFTKNLDLDTKDFKPQGKGETNFYQAWILKIKFEKWAREGRLSKDINSLLGNISDFGFGVWKRVPDDEGETIDKCNLKNIYFDITDKSFRTVIEEHELTEMQVRKKGEAWDNIDQALQHAEKVSDEKFVGADTIEKYRFYERVGEYKDGKDYKYMHHIVCGEGSNEVIVFEEELEDNIYHCFSLDNAEGRLPGIGIYERLFVLQERANTLVNENAQTTAIASLLLLRTQDSELNGNVLSDMESGQIITSEDLQQIGIDNRFLNGFITELDRLEDQARKLCMTPEVVTGEKLPSGTPFRSMAALTVAAKSAFEMTREDIGTKIADILIDHILPSVARTWNKEEIVEIADNDQDIRLYDEAIVKFAQAKVLKENIAKGKYTTEEELLEIDDQVKREIETIGRKVKIEKGFFNFEYGIIINPVGENYDKSQQNETYFNAITMIMQNPAILNLPLMKQYLENNGVSWWKIKPEQIKELQQANQQMPQAEPKANMLKETQV